MKRLKTLHYVLLGAALLLVGAALWAYSLWRQVSAPLISAGSAPFELLVDADDTADSIFARLEPASAPQGMSGLRLLAHHYDYAQRVRTGRYVITPGHRALDVFRQLRSGRQQPIMLTVPAVRTMPAMAAKLGARLMADSTQLARLLCTAEGCQQLGYDTATIACLFVPNTYEVYWDVAPEALLQRLQREHDAYWNDERRKLAAGQGLTPNEVATLASIIDEETANDTEKPMIAGMYLNRLHQGMLLQADPTVKYAVGDVTLRRILNRHLEVESPYNTYLHEGLPPGPLRVASVQALEAVLHPAQHDYLYMCANADFSGTHLFARTLAEHMQNARRYQQALNQRGIK